MRQIERPLPLCAIILGAAAFCLGQTAPATAPLPSKLTVVNIRQVYEGLDEKADADRDLEKMKDDFSREIDTRKAEITRLSAEVENPTIFKRESPEHRKMQDDLLEKLISLQTYSQYAPQKLFLEQRIRALQVHGRISAAIAAYAQTHDIALVMVTDELNAAAARTPAELDMIPTMRKLAYVHTAYDITRTIREKMNVEYKIGPKR